jgi:hypothetical protein
MKTSFFLLFFLLLNYFGYTQTFDWAKGKHGNSSGNSIGYDKDGNVICSGSTPSSCFIEKHSDKGDLIWSKSINNSASIKTKVDSLGNIYASGVFYKTILIDDKSLYSSATASFLVKFNSSGSIIWLKSINDVVCQDIALHDSDFYITGGFSILTGNVLFDSIGFKVNNLFIAKYNEFGKCTWVTQGNFDARGSIDRIITTDNLGNVYCKSPGFVSNSNNYCVVSKFNRSGDFLWAKDFGGNVRSLSANNNKLYISGDFGGSITIGDKVFTARYQESAYIIKIQDTGSIESYKVFYASTSLGFTSITLDNEENIYITGNIEGDADLGGKLVSSRSNGNNFGAQVFVAKFNSQIDVMWGINSTSTYSTANFANAICYNKFNKTILFCGSVEYDVNFGSTTLSQNAQGGSMFISKITDTSIATGIDPHHLDPNLISIFPNPTTGIVKIENKESMANTQIFVKNLLGHTILLKEFSEPSVSFDLTGYPKGIYFIDVLSMEGKITKKIVLQ